MKNIGVFGGTFNPVHTGHLIAAQEVYHKLNLDKIIFMPAGSPPHKPGSEIAPASERLEMVRLAIAGNAAFDVSDIEIKRQGKTYTFDTLMELRQVYGDSRIFFIVGFDTLKEMDNWKKISEVFKMACFVVVNRNNFDKDMEDEIENKNRLYGACIEVVKIPDIGISSTDIRKRIIGKESIRYLVPDKVADYICLKGLYNNNDRLRRN